MVKIILNDNSNNNNNSNANNCPIGELFSHWNFYLKIQLLFDT